MARLTASKRPALTAPQRPGVTPPWFSNFVELYKKRHECAQLDSFRPRGIRQNPRVSTNKILETYSCAQTLTKGSYGTFKQLLPRTKRLPSRF